MPPFLKSCLRGHPLHPLEEIHGDSVRPLYEFPCWTTSTIYPPEGVEHLLQTSLNWHKWVTSGALLMKQPHLETSTLSPADIEQIVAQLEEARQLLLDRIAHAEAEEARITEEIASWEDIVYKSAALDIAQYRTKRIHST